MAIAGNGGVTSDRWVAIAGEGGGHCRRGGVASDRWVAIAGEGGVASDRWVAIAGEGGWPLQEKGWPLQERGGVASDRWVAIAGERGNHVTCVPPTKGTTGRQLLNSKLGSLVICNMSLLSRTWER